MKDYHLHSGLLDHTEDNLGEILKTVSDLGFEEVAITEHLTWFLAKNPIEIGEGRYDTLYPEKEKIPQDGRKTASISDYLELIDNFKKNLKIKVLKGLEVDYFSEYEEEIKNCLRKYNFDIILGSCHYIPFIELPQKYFCIDDSDKVKLFIKKYGKDKLYFVYFENIMSAIKSKIFDFIAHIDLLKRNFKEYDYNKADFYIEPLLKEMISNNIGIEINLSGLKDIGETYPSRNIIEKYIKLGGKKISIGSDSHSISRIKKMAPIMSDFSKIYGKFINNKQ